MRRVMMVALAAVMLAQGVVLAQSGASESYSEHYGSGAKKVRTAELIDINRASAEELTKLPGMTKVWADRVVKFRPYKKKTELLEHGVLPGKVYDMMKDFVVAHQIE